MIATSTAPTATAAMVHFLRSAMVYPPSFWALLDRQPSFQSLPYSSLLLLFQCIIASV